jgi:hypothetical protein
MFERVSVRDVSALGKGVREEEREEQRCERTVRGRHPHRFRTTEEAVRALLRVNPDLLDFVERECSHVCKQYRVWLQRGRRGSKPAPTFDGRFDAIEVPLDLHGARRISSWLEALYITPPPSRRWEDFAPRLQHLADATGLALHLPEEAEALAVGDSDVEHCRSVADERVEALIALARASRLPGAGEPASDADVPF